MITVLLPPGAAVPGAAIELDPAELHHLRVRRMPPDGLVRLRDGEGLAGSGRLCGDGKRVQVVVESIERRPAPAPLRLAVAAGDRDRFGWLVEKGAELSVTDVIPVETARTAGVASRLRETHLAGLRRRAREALKQCGGFWAPRVHAPTTLAALLAAPPEGVLWLADPAGGPPPGGAATGSLTVLVGPEGGLTAQESAAALGAGFRPVRLGAHILRFETAAVAVAAYAAIARVGDRDG